MRGKDPFRKPEFGDERERLERLGRDVQENLKAVDAKASALFGACRIVSMAEQTVIVSISKSVNRMIPRYVTIWENAVRDVLGRMVVLVVRSEG